MNIPAAITKPYSLSQAGAVSALDRPSTRGVWFDAESGQTLRHSPGTTSHSSGSDGDDELPQHEQAVVGGDDERHGEADRAEQGSDADAPARRRPADASGICV